MAIYKLTNVGASKCLNIYGSNLTSLYNSINVVIWADSGTNEQKWSITSLGTGVYVRSVIDTAYGLNVYRSGSPYNCNIYAISGNETDSQVNFIADGSYYKIKLTNYNYYLTVGGSTNGDNVYWDSSSTSNFQKWNVSEITASNNYTYPTSSLIISTAYSTDHPGIDIPGTAGTTPIYAFAAGKVSWKQTYNSNWDPSNDDATHNSSTMNSMGNAVAINYNNPDTTIMTGTYARSIYMHMYSPCALSEGTSVSKGDIIGYIGNTGRSSAAHLHFCLSVGSLTSMAPNQQGWVSISDLPNKNAVNSYLPNYHF